MNMNDAFLGSLIFNKNGGGSDGHTIVDNEGVSLEQRTNLQFKGVYSEDNATDDTTEVNVVREMTKAEFDLLSADEKVGLINITDITGGNDDRFQPVIYSEEEREIGVWIDGKPLYEKTIDFGALPNATTKSVNHNISNLDKVAFLNGVAYKSGDIIPVPFSHSSNVSNQPQLSIRSTTVNIRTANDQSDRTGYITVRYTKTTDAAGSGQWTPQGVPTHHYSEDEQVVGTWIDGSTLYEKTVYISSLPNNSTSEYITGLSNITPISFDDTLIFQSGNTSKAPYTSTNGSVAIAIQFNANGKIFFGTNTDQSLTSAYVTLRYTKSST